MRIYDILKFLLLHFFCADMVTAISFERFISPGGCGSLQTKQVSLKQGLARGRTLVTPSGRPFCAFHGLPFAQPPVGALRFRPPLPPKPWKGILDAYEEPPECLQFSLMPGITSGEEDCLYLNVYTPYLKPPNGKLLSVIVWFYAGAYIAGDVHIGMFGPHYLVDKDVIMVFLNFRAGVFGYLSTGDDESPGNYGLKDQVAALHWIQDNIVAFGGNASSVTLLGLSSGGGSIHYHMMSPLSAGLFHRAISLEGTAIDSVSRIRDPLKQAEKQACLVDCPIDSTKKLVECLREANAHDLAVSTYNLFKWFLFPSAGYGPVIEKKTERNPEPLVTEDPITLLRKGRFNRVPFMLGGTENGGIIISTVMTKLNILLKQFNENFKVLLPKLLTLDNSVFEEQLNDIVQIVKEKYMGAAETISMENKTILSDMLTDRTFGHSVHKTFQLHVMAGHTELYRYKFAYKGVVAMSMRLGLENYGICHADEILYIFKIPVPIPKNHVDFEVKDTMTSLIVNFARHGNPTPGNSGFNFVDELIWPTVVDPGSNSTNFRYLNIGQVVVSPKHIKYLNQGLGPMRLEIMENPFKERMEFWDTLDIYENCVSDCGRYFK
ncbi:juvenile hormone esterase-like [Periplaneta americana]|uniref:juvenile hormone esterase-like n=1 Tax=Periplaneta americana TaxID=6978 RepID=UPI0037E9B1F5